jgi:Rrf2 family protein
MRISTRGRYAARALVDIALFQEGGPVSLREICERQGLSPKYLDQVLTRLKQAGIIRALRGARGGFVLAKPSEEIDLLSVILAVEGPVQVVDCVQDALFCEKSETCVTRGLWIKVSKAVEQVLASTRLKDLIDNAKKLDSVTKA